MHFVNNSSKRTGLLLGSLNVRSLNNKSASVTDLLSEMHLDVFALQETWHENSNSLSLNRAVPPGYNVVDAARPSSCDRVGMATISGGGVAIIYRSDLKCHKVTTLPSVRSFEYVCCRLTTSQRNELTVLSMYRPGSHAVTNEFFTEFCKLLEALATFRCPVVILGDINIHLQRPDDAHSVELTELLESFDMSQHVKQTTHKSGGLLDVIIGRNNDIISDVEIHEVGISDHHLLTLKVDVQITPVECSPSVGRKWHQFSLDAFRQDLSNSIICNDNCDWMKSLSIDQLFDIYDNELRSLIDLHAPHYVRKRKKRALTPWFDDACRNFKRTVRRLERKYRKSRSPSDRTAWVLKLKEQAIYYRQKECLYWSNRITNNASNPKRLWQDIEVLMRHDDENPIVSQTESTMRAEDFSNFFNNKVTSIRDATASASQPVFESRTEKTFEKFIPTTASDIFKLISSASNKSCGLDPIPTNLVKSCADLLSTFIAELFNRSLNDGYIPPSQKSAYVTPHLKKRGLDVNDSKNFRPVSNLSFLSKLLERVVSTQLNNYLNATGTLPSTQSAYRKFHSTETALLKVFTDLCHAIDDGNTCLLGLLDLSAAFDTVDHNILLTRLDLSFGVKGSVLKWFNSYLSDRTQTVQVAGCSSTKSPLKCGVPQGSILGPLLFIIYTSSVTDIVCRHSLLSHCYEDDTQLYFYCRPDQLDDLVLKLSNCVSELECWMASNRLKLNCDKTEFIWMVSRRKLETLHNSLPLTNIGSQVISPVTGARNLGVFLTAISTLNNTSPMFVDHVILICASFVLFEDRYKRMSLKCCYMHLSLIWQTRLLQLSFLRFA